MKVRLLAKARSAAVPTVSILTVLVGLVLVLLAVDVSRTAGRIERDDLRFQSTPEPSDLWEASTMLPAEASRRALGVGDDIAFREALRTFRLSGPRTPGTLSSASFEVRGDAQLRLSERVDDDSDPSRRSTAANLVGVLSLLGAADVAVADRETFVTRAIQDFQRAVELNPENDDAAYNVELALRLQRAVRRSGQGNQPPESRANPTSRAAGAGGFGSGY
jgi:hypothetical protein